ncbi:YfbM family protein [Rufibacter hautae]|uniref:DUF1877 family protein n=1 Tax=Rufibacter hautae TaxID=2595005 RepID=A0A5B6TKH0_9BACT|nr:YfbM family protein [Rufibacter hautae]KAA3440783.1 DUF1877 family protein [Rufibacter hautae]
MGMIGNLYRVSPEELEEILRNSSILEDKVYSEDQISSEYLLDLDKSWEGIFYLLTGFGINDMEEVKPPLSWAIFGEQMIDEEQDMGYGPATYRTPEQVKVLNLALATISEDTLHERYNSKAMMEAGVYPQIWDQEEAFEYLQENFKQLKEFYAIAEKEQNAVISFLN